jgi:hypothetical protein
VTIRVARAVELPYRDQPGRCPVCGAEPRPGPADVFPVGTWSGRDEATGQRAGGQVFGANCPECGAVLRSFRRGAWTGVDPAGVVWHSDGDRGLVGGDRWRGRPGAWCPADAPLHEARLREMAGRCVSLDEAVRVLHASAGLGALPLASLVEQVAGLSSQEAKRLVVRALTSAWGEYAEPASVSPTNTPSEQAAAPPDGRIT